METPFSHTSGVADAGSSGSKTHRGTWFDQLHPVTAFAVCLAFLVVGFAVWAIAAAVYFRWEARADEAYRATWLPQTDHPISHLRRTQLDTEVERGEVR